MTTDYCRDLVLEIIGDAVELGKAPEIDLHDMFGAVDIRGGDYAGKGGGKGGSGLEQVASGGGERGWKVVVGDEGRDVKVEVKNRKGEKITGNKVEGGVLKVVVKGGDGGPKFVETEADNAGRERGWHVCNVHRYIFPIVIAK